MRKEDRSIASKWKNTEKREIRGKGANGRKNWKKHLRLRGSLDRLVLRGPEKCEAV